MAKIAEVEETTLVRVKYNVQKDQLVLTLKKLGEDKYVPFDSAQMKDIFLFWGTMENFQNDLKNFLAEQNK